MLSFPVLIDFCCMFRSELIGFVNALTTSSSTDVQVFMRVDAELAYVKVVKFDDSYIVSAVPATIALVDLQL